MLNNLKIIFATRTVILHDCGAINVIVGDKDGEVFSSIKQAIKQEPSPEKKLFRRMISNATISFLLKKFLENGLLVVEVSLGTDDIFINQSSMKRYFTFGEHVFELQNELKKEPAEIFCIQDPGSYIGAQYLSAVAAFCGVQFFVFLDERKDVSESLFSFALSSDVRIFGDSTDEHSLQTVHLDVNRNCSVKYDLMPFASDEDFDL